MSTENTNRTYHDFDPEIGYPAGSNLFYECMRCGDVIPSVPLDSTSCKCRNVMIDTDYGRVSVQDHILVKLFTT
jgi:hypothetical protein